MIKILNKMLLKFHRVEILIINLLKSYLILPTK